MATGKIDIRKVPPLVTATLASFSQAELGDPLGRFSGFSMSDNLFSVVGFDVTIALAVAVVSIATIIALGETDYTRYSGLTKGLGATTGVAMILQNWVPEIGDLVSNEPIAAVTAFTLYVSAVSVLAYET